MAGAGRDPGSAPASGAELACSVGPGVASAPGAGVAWAEAPGAGVACAEAPDRRWPAPKPGPVVGRAPERPAPGAPAGSPAGSPSTSSTRPLAIVASPVILADSAAGLDTFVELVDLAAEVDHGHGERRLAARLVDRRGLAVAREGERRLPDRDLADVGARATHPGSLAAGLGDLARAAARERERADHGCRRRQRLGARRRRRLTMRETSPGDPILATWRVAGTFLVACQGPDLQRHRMPADVTAGEAC